MKKKYYDNLNWNIFIYNIVKFDEDFNLLKESSKCGTKCEKGLKVWHSYYIKMGVKSVAWGKLLNKKCGTFEKVWHRVG